MARRHRDIDLPAPYLRRIRLDPDLVGDPRAYPFCLPIFRGGLDLAFTHPITILIGENGSGKSTLLEGIASLAGYDDAGGGKGYRPLDHSRAVETHGGTLAQALRATWLPRLTQGWFFRAESFYSVARYLDQAALDAHQVPPDLLSHSHAEGFMRFFEERFGRQGIYMLDEPESALSPARQIDFLRVLRGAELYGKCQVIMATHSPILMAYPGATLLHLTNRGLEPTVVEATDHFRMMSEFVADPHGFAERALDG